MATVYYFPGYTTNDYLTISALIFFLLVVAGRLIFHHQIVNESLLITPAVVPSESTHNMSPQPQGDDEPSIPENVWMLGAHGEVLPAALRNIVIVILGSTLILGVLPLIATVCTIVAPSKGTTFVAVFCMLIPTLVIIGSVAIVYFLEKDNIYHAEENESLLTTPAVVPSETTLNMSTQGDDEPTIPGNLCMLCLHGAVDCARIPRWVFISYFSIILILWVPYMIIILIYNNFAEPPMSIGGK